jgi:hypothetical protein
MEGSFYHIFAASNMPEREGLRGVSSEPFDSLRAGSKRSVPDSYGDSGISAKNGTTLAFKLRFLLAFCERT